jgi:hypothetical protein
MDVTQFTPQQMNSLRKVFHVWNSGFRKASALPVPKKYPIRRIACS